MTVTEAQKKINAFQIAFYQGVRTSSLKETDKKLLNTVISRLQVLIQKAILPSDETLPEDQKIGDLLKDAKEVLQSVKEIDLTAMC